MTYHRDHIARFLKTSATSAEQDEEIMARAESVISIGEEEAGIFSATNLEKILGDPELVNEFNGMWNTGQLLG